MDIAVLGPGGVGGFLAAALEKAGHDVTLIVRDRSTALTDTGELIVDSERLGQLTAQPALAESLAAEVDALIVATKAPGLSRAIERIEGEPHLVVPMLNGLDHLEPLRERFGPRAVAAAIRIESTRTAPGRIEQTSPFLLVELASRDPRMRASVDHFADALNEAGIPARVRNSEADVMWAKLVRLNALALTTTAYDVPLGPIRSTPELRSDLEGCVGEAVAVARADGADASVARTMDELDEAHDSLDSSMHRDVAAGREPELDAIAGSVLRAAARHDLGCPTIERLAAQVAERAGIATPAPR